ncbi:hypothetical protein [Rhizobium oryzicola]|uniref:Tail assembly chaperone n=1 Tax=Rhizobium oryzicola TaxID=1232668 RepID=A0ABT8SVJ3_9HYPH|nr:hypothetical protein [Rhizobium oryzicola]MDO1582432.1 hypothetical protein [Rhizobium oryzicola]
MPEEAEPQIWDRFIWRAWDVLKFDRTYPGMGGEMPIPYRAYTQYAADHDIRGEDFAFFLKMMTAIDDEYLSWRAEQAERQAQERKARG